MCWDRHRQQKRQLSVRSLLSSKLPDYMSFTLPLVMVMHDLEYLVQYDRDVSGNTYWWKRVQGAETNEFTIISGIVPGAFHFPTKRIPNSIFFLFTNGCHCESLLMT